MHLFTERTYSTMQLKDDITHVKIYYMGTTDTDREDTQFHAPNNACGLYKSVMTMNGKMFSCALNTVSDILPQ